MAEKKGQKKRVRSDEEKRSVGGQTLVPGVSVAPVARRFSMNYNLIFTGLRDPQYAPGSKEEICVSEDGDIFLPVEVSGLAVDDQAHAASLVTADPANRSIVTNRVDIALSDGCRIVVEGSTESSAVVGLVQGLMNGSRCRVTHGSGWLPGSWTCGGGGNTLAAQAVKTLAEDPYSDHRFAFRGRGDDLLKIIWWMHRGPEPCGIDHVSERASTVSHHCLEQLSGAIRTTEQKEGSMGKIPQARFIRIDVNLDWLDIHYLPEGKRLGMVNKLEGHEQVAQLAHELGALVCFEGYEDEKSIRGFVFPSGGGLEWRLWSTLDAAGIATRADKSLRRQPGHTRKDRSDRRGAHCAVHGFPTQCGMFIAT